MAVALLVATVQALLVIWLLGGVPAAELRLLPLAMFMVTGLGLWAIDVISMKSERLWRRRSLRPRARMRFGARGVAQTCAYCHTDLEHDSSAACDGCQTHYHLECLNELGHCASLGCNHSRSRVRLTHPDKL